MRYFFSAEREIKRQISGSSGILLMLDFDGTLSPIAATPDEARLPKNIRNELKKAAVMWPVAIVSGRSLADVRKKIGIAGIFYSGNHGLEWADEAGKKLNTQVKPPSGALRKFKSRLNRLRPRYPGMLLEDKGLSLAVHYRKVEPERIKVFKRDVDKVTGTLLGSAGLRKVVGKKVVEFRPQISWNKGDLSLALVDLFEQRLKKKLMPIYVGDDVTDEDAFCALSGGVTVRVGRKRKSFSRYYVRDQAQVLRLLYWLREKYMDEPKKLRRSYKL